MIIDIALGIVLGVIVIAVLVVGLLGLLDLFGPYR